jgi:hypothetical protein
MAEDGFTAHLNHHANLRKFQLNLPHAGVPKPLISHEIHRHYRHQLSGALVFCLPPRLLSTSSSMLNDLILIGPMASIQPLAAKLATRFKAAGPPSRDSFQYLGMSITRDRSRRTIQIDQAGYISKILERFGMQGVTRLYHLCRRLHSLLYGLYVKEEECDHGNLNSARLVCGVFIIL